jgi:hypothetical protein
MKRFGTFLFGMALALVAGCTSDADRVSQNTTTAADNFEILRRVVFYNGITGEYLLEVTGLCSIGNAATGKNGMYVLCKTGPTTYKKHFLGLSDNVTFFVEQLEPNKADAFHYRVIFKPANIIPDLEMK